MFSKRKKTLRKNMAIFVCVAFVSLLLPRVTHAETSSSSSVSLNAYAFSVANLTVTIVVYGSTDPEIDLARDSSGNVSSTKKPKKDRD